LIYLIRDTGNCDKLYWVESDMMYTSKEILAQHIVADHLRCFPQHYTKNPEDWRELIKWFEIVDYGEILS